MVWHESTEKDMDRAHICDRKLELPVARKTGKQIPDLSDTNISQVWVTES